MRVAIISLKRTQERWTAFQQRNQQALGKCEQLRIEGIDGITLLDSNINTGLITASARKSWSAGAIGVGLSHRLCWRMCCESGTPLVVLEDDVLLAKTGSCNWRNCSIHVHAWCFWDGTLTQCCEPNSVINKR